LKVPTYQKYGLTKSQLEKFEEKNRKVTQLLTHQIPLALGLLIGILIYVLNYRKFNPDTIMKVLGQVFLFASLGVICLGLPLMFFKIVDSWYYTFLEKTNSTYRKILQYQKDKEKFEYWHIRTDEKFWNLVDGRTFEKEVVNIYVNLGYEIKSEMLDAENITEYILRKNSKDYYLKCITNKKIDDIAEAEKLTNVYNTNFAEIIIVLKKGYSKEVYEKLNIGKVKILSVKDVVNLMKTIDE
jgi:hypothetical protein